jgi:sigma-E factor negative regulatory protein RseB
MSHAIPIARGLLGLLATMLVPIAAVAQPASDDARAWLQRMAQAATTVNMQGTMVHTAGGNVSSSRLTRYGQGKHSFELSETLDGPTRRIYRHDHVVHTLWPDKKVAVVEQREALAPFPALPDGGEEPLRSYEVRLEAVERVAGHLAQVMVLEPRDGHRHAQRLWADQRSGLMLRADVLGADGRVLESSSFTELKIGVKPQPEALLGAMRKLDGYRIVKAGITATQLEREGWRLEVPVPGFRQISCVKRPREGDGASSGASLLQSIYSDGLVHVSVFIEPYDATRHQPVQASWGATQTVSQRRGDARVTVMGDVPAATVQRFVTALEPLTR